MIPENIVEAAAAFDMFGVIFFSLLFGIFLLLVEEKAAAGMLSFIEGGAAVMMKMTQFVISLAPVGIAALIATTVATSGPSIFISLLPLRPDGGFSFSDPFPCDPSSLADVFYGSSSLPLHAGHEPSAVDRIFHGLQQWDTGRDHGTGPTGGGALQSHHQLCPALGRHGEHGRNGPL